MEKSYIILGNGFSIEDGRTNRIIQKETRVVNMIWLPWFLNYIFNFCSNPHEKSSNQPLIKAPHRKHSQRPLKEVTPQKV